MPLFRCQHFRNALYLSQAVVTSAATLINPNFATAWAAYNPSSNIFFDPSTAIFAPHSFFDVRAVGYYFSETSQGFAEYTPNVGSFEVNAATGSAVPDASNTLFLLAVSFGLLGLVALPRRVKNY